jgi:hypothetical protein
MHACTPQVEALPQELRGEEDARAALRHCHRVANVALGLLRELREERDACVTGSAAAAAAARDPASPSASLLESSSLLGRCCTRVAHACLAVARAIGAELLLPASLSPGVSAHAVTNCARALPIWWRGCSDLCFKV